ncbi:hypothetical protein VP249E411_P0079 [Vibrio phage 249E41-1]|nr:hypothetical protein VP249E411_P0079 [Vibrio phage 249E41-1]
MAATDFETAVDQTITASNQLHEVVNGSSTETVTTDSGEIPSVRKVLTDSMMYLPSIPWVQGEDETNLFQPRIFGDQIYWAPNATTNNPVPMGFSPVGDSNWFLAPVSLNKNFVANTFNYDGLIYQGIGNISDFAGQQLQDADKTNAYQYPDNSRQFYAADKSQIFPITIPADPSGADGWTLVNALTSESLGTYTERSYSSIGDMISGTPVAASVGDVVSTGRSKFKKILSTNGDITDFECLGELYLDDFGDVFDGINKNDSEYSAAISVSNQIKLESGTLYLSERHDVSNRLIFRFDLLGNNLKLDLTTLTSVQGVVNSLDYAFYFDGIGILDLVNFNLSFGLVSNYTGIHRTFAASETVGDAGCGSVLVENVNITGGFSSVGSQGGVFFNNKISKNFEVSKLKWDNETLPSGFSQSYRVLFNCEFRDQDDGTGNSRAPSKVHYHDIEMRNANAPDSDGMLRVAGANLATIERIKSVGVSKPVKIRTQDNSSKISGEFTENVASVRDSEFIDFSDWAINCDTLNNDNFKPYRILIENNTFDILNDTFGGSHWGVYLLPIHNVSVIRNTFKRLHSDLRLRTFKASEPLPRGTDKTFSNIKYIGNKSSECKDRAITANDFTSTYSCYGTVSNFTISDSHFEKGAGAEAYVDLQDLLNSDIYSCQLGEKGATQPNRAINVGSSLLSTRVKIYGNDILGNYTSNPLVYTNSGNEWLGDNYIYNNTFSDTDDPFSYAIAKPMINRREWYSPTNLPPSPSEAEDAEMKLGEIIIGKQSGGSVTEWMVTGVTPGAFEIKARSIVYS